MLKYIVLALFLSVPANAGFVCDVPPWLIAGPFGCHTVASPDGRVYNQPELPPDYHQSEGTAQGIQQHDTVGTVNYQPQNAGKCVQPAGSSISGCDLGTNQNYTNCKAIGCVWQL